MNQHNYLKPIVVGGLILGFLSGIPIVQACNCFCCLWVVLGGGIAGYLLVQSAVYYPGDGEGAMAGLGAGVLGGILAALLNYVQLLVVGPESMIELMDKVLQASQLPTDLEESFRKGFEQSYRPGIFSFIIGLMSNVFFFGAMGALGGFLGVRIFRPRRFGSFPRGGMYPGYGPGWPPGGGPGYGGYPPPGPGGPGMTYGPGGYYPPPPSANHAAGTYPSAPPSPGYPLPAPGPGPRMVPPGAPDWPSPGQPSPAGGKPPGNEPPKGDAGAGS